MSGLVYIASLLLLSAIPLLVAYWWLAKVRPFFVPLPFVAAALSGLVAVAFAAVIQSLFPRNSLRSAPLFQAFIVIALSEEGSKYLVLLFSGPLYSRISRRLSLVFSDSHSGAIIGITASLGFVLFETALYASVEPKIALLRAFTAAPVHTAAGARIGSAAFSSQHLGPKAPLSILAALVLHGTYDLSLILPGFPLAVPIVLAVLSLIFTINSVKPESTPGDF